MDFANRGVLLTKFITVEDASSLAEAAEEVLESSDPLSVAPRAVVSVELLYHRVSITTQTSHRHWHALG